MPNKYKNKKITQDGIQFDSQSELDYFNLLVELEKKGIIEGFEEQVKYELQERFIAYNGEAIRSINYIVDFIVRYKNGFKIAVDIKGMSTQQGEMRRKMFLYKYPNIPLIWLAKSKKYGNRYGWIDWFKLQKIRKENRRCKA